ncbi:mitochondrial protein Pet127 [Spinellus fusiger]|nr:mitochondrial protein Pet127 [Spinellus fusiger]
MPVPGLAHQLDRVLFSPGVHRLQDPTTKEYNFNPFLEYITQPADFNYDALRAYITSSKDESLLDLAIAHKQRYVGSTSSISSAMSHFYFTMSNFKPVNLDNLSEPFQTESDRFTRGNRAPTTICLRWNRGVYAIDADKSFDVEDTILSLMGRSMEKVLTLEPEKYKNYLKENSEGWAKDSKDLESYAYGKIGKFLLRSQLDCYHPDLKRGTFDLKTRAVIPIRLDMPNYSEYLGYTLKDNCGLLQSFEREYYDMIRSAFLKYNFQVRIGHMDGIMVTYHNTRKMFGFQYISRDEIDTRLFGSKQMGGEVFRNILVMFEEVLDMATKKYPEQVSGVG